MVTTKEIITILGNREGGEVTKIVTGSYFLPLPALTTPMRVLHPRRQHSGCTYVSTIRYSRINIALKR